MITFDALRDANVDRCNSAYEVIRNIDRQFWSNATAGEVGELTAEALVLLAALSAGVGGVCNLTKKIARASAATQVVQNWNRIDDQQIDEMERRVAMEAADVVIYLDLLMARCGLSLGDAVREKFNAKSIEIGSSVRL